jgi:cytochrome P450 PksS
MRREAPVYPLDSPDAPISWNRGIGWYFTRYDDCVAVLRDTKRFVKDVKLAFDPEDFEGQPPDPPFVAIGNRSMINQEDPEHSRLRRLVSLAFSPGRVRRMRNRIVAIADELLDDIVQRGGETDLKESFAFLLPINVIAEILGFPREDHHKLRDWAPLAPPQNAEEAQRVQEGVDNLTDYLHGMFEQRRSEPRDDLITALIQAESNGERLSEDDLLAMVILLTSAGFETTMNTILNGTLALLRHPAQLELLRRRPDLVESAVEEILRYDPPIHTATLRWAAVDVEMRGQLIRRGDRVLPVVAAANRDPERFPAPDRFDILREDNKHIAFGIGTHFCTGAPLARLELQIAFPLLLKRLPNLRLAIPEDQVEWEFFFPFRRLAALPVTWG